MELAHDVLEGEKEGKNGGGWEVGEYRNTRSRLKPKFFF